MSEWRFTCIYSHSPSLILPLELCLLSDQQEHNKCKALESPPNHPPPPSSSSWKNHLLWKWSLVPKWLGATGVKSRMVEEKLGSHFHALLNIYNIMYCDCSWSKMMLLINLDSQRETENNRGFCKFFRCCFPSWTLEQQKQFSYIYHQNHVFLSFHSIGLLQFGCSRK